MLPSHLFTGRFAVLVLTVQLSRKFRPSFYHCPSKFPGPSAKKFAFEKEEAYIRVLAVVKIRLPESRKSRLITARFADTEQN